MVPERDPAQLGLGKRGTRSDFSKDALSSTQSRSSHQQSNGNPQFDEIEPKI